MLDTLRTRRRNLVRRIPNPRRTHGGAAKPIRLIEFERFVCGRHLGRHGESSGTASDGYQGKDMVVVKQEKSKKHG